MLFDVLKDVAMRSRAWERLDMLDDDVEFRTKTFDLGVAGKLTVNVVYERDPAGRLRPVSLNASFDNSWAVDYAALDGGVSRFFVHHERRRGALHAVHKFDCEGPPPGMDFGRWTYLTALHPGFMHLLCPVN